SLSRDWSSDVCSSDLALRGTSWIVAYILLAVFPLLVLLSGDVPPGGGFGWDFAMAVGFGGLAIMGLQSVLTARFRRATAPFGVRAAERGGRGDYVCGG